MNRSLKDIVENCKPKIENLSLDEIGIYKIGLEMISILVCKEFIDMPILPLNRFDTDGLFYEIPFLHANELWSSGNKRTMIVVYEVKDRSSYCPLRIDFELVDKENFSIIVYNQSGEKNVKKVLFGKEDGEYITDIPHFMNIKLSEILDN